jgi:hypothetical protein
MGLISSEVEQSILRFRISLVSGWFGGCARTDVQPLYLRKHTDVRMAGSVYYRMSDRVTGVRSAEPHHPAIEDTDGSPSELMRH